MKIIFYVKKRTLLIIAGFVWLIAGFNVARLGVLSYLEINRKWYLYLLSAVVFLPVWLNVLENEQQTHKKNYGI